MYKFMIWFEAIILALSIVGAVGITNAGVDFSMVSSLNKQTAEFMELTDRLEEFMMKNAEEIMHQELTEDMTQTIFDLQMEGLKIIGDKKILREAWMRVFRYIKEGSFVDAGQTMELMRSSVSTTPVGNVFVSINRPLTKEEMREWKRK